MAVYVDTMKAPYRGMIMCHMMAETTAELLDMADAIGLDRKWIQRPGTPYEHFDVSKSKRSIAIEKGAIEVQQRYLGHLIRKKKEALSSLINSTKA